jgi:hypothetical protein
MGETAGQEFASQFHQKGFGQAVNGLNQPLIEFGCKKGVANSGHRLRVIGRRICAGCGGGCVCFHRDGLIIAMAQPVSN